MVELVDLGPDILHQILLKLPIKTIFTTRCLCKTLLDVTSHPKNKPYFFTALEEEESQKLHNINNLLVIQCREKHSKLPKPYIKIIDVQHDIIEPPRPRLVSNPVFVILPKSQHDHLIKPIDLSREHQSIYSNEYALVNSCNGLLYFAVKSSLQFSCFVCNPFTHQRFWLRKRFSHYKFTLTASLWLGFSPISGEYKVVRFFHYKSRSGTALDYGRAAIYEVYSSSGTMSTSPSRLVKSPEPLYDVIRWDDSYAFINGIGYWLCGQHEDGDADFIISFDFESETLGTIDAPPSFNHDRCRDRMGIGVVGGDCDNLCLIDNTDDHHLDIWMIMKINNYKDIKSSSDNMINNHNWVKKFTCPKENYMQQQPEICRAMLRPLQVMSSTGDHILMVSDNGRNQLVLYDVKENSLRRFMLPDTDIGKDFTDTEFRVVDFIPSFVSIFDTLSIPLSDRK